MSEPLSQCPDCHLCFKQLSTHSPFCAALGSDESACSVGPSSYGLLASAASESLNNDNSTHGDDDNSWHSKPVDPFPPGHKDPTPEHVEHFKLDVSSIHSGGTKSNTDSSAKSLAHSFLMTCLASILWNIKNAIQKSQKN